MDKEIKMLLVEVAKAVLRVLDPPAKVAVPAPAVERKAAVITPQAALPLPDAAPPVVRGDAVRIWTGSMYAVGTVDSICRGTPKKIKVRVSRGEGRRDSLHTVEATRAVVVAKGAA